MKLELIYGGKLKLTSESLEENERIEEVAKELRENALRYKVDVTILNTLTIELAADKSDEHEY